MSRTDFNSHQVLHGPWLHFADGTLSSSGVGVMSDVASSRVSTVTPAFGSERYALLYRKRKRPVGTAVLPMNPFYFERNVWKPCVGHWNEFSTTGPSSSIYTGYLNDIFGSNGGQPWEPDSELKLILEDQLNAKLLGKLKDQKVNLAQVFAERRLTANLIADTAIKCAAAFSSLRKGRIREAAKILGSSVSRSAVTRYNKLYPNNAVKAACNGWLELRYGWMPLIDDVYGSAQWLAAKQHHEIRDQVKASVKRKDVQDVNDRSDPRFENLYLRSGMYEVSSSIWFSTTGAEMATVKEAGMLNPAQLAWELLPYSFVVDWFLPVGNFLSSMDATIGLSFDMGCRTEFLKSRSSTSFLNPGGTIASTRYYIELRGSREKIYCRRIPLVTFPEVSLPRFKNPFSFVHAANAIALLGQVFTFRK